MTELEFHGGFDTILDRVKLNFENETLDFIKKFEEKVLNRRKWKAVIISCQYLK
ncbi:hypothetical protein [Maribacter litoralis]|uniref:hypothetical protein n=1 Tax=Maribacter litoralis TaxID=2059726 RepID=UPI003F5CD41E